MIRLFFLIAISACTFYACDKNIVQPTNYYDCTFNFQDSSSTHSKSADYQSILENNTNNKIIGATMLVKDSEGLWIGANGKADIASDVDVQACNPFLIASISKMFTATVTMSLIEEGKLALDDLASDFLSQEVVDKVANVKESTIKHLLNHTSGIPDYYTLQYELDRINKVHDDWRQETTLSYTYGVNPTNAVGETYYYSNTNYVLLGMIIEKASGKSLSEMYAERIFTPLNLTSAYYGTDEAIPTGTVKGYADIYDNGQYAETRFLYKDELRTGDGGIIINAYDLAVFVEALMKGNLVNQNTLNEMTAWFDLPTDWIDDGLGHNRNGLGLEYFTNDKGYAIGHTGGVDGFSTLVHYFPELDKTIVILTNSIGDSGRNRAKMVKEVMEIF